MTEVVVDEVLLGLIHGFGAALVIVGILAVGYLIVWWMSKR